MNNELFDIQESLSPRMKWMLHHHLTTIDCGDTVPPDKRWMVKHGMKPVAFASDEIAALIEACKVLKINDWRGKP